MKMTIAGLKTFVSTYVDSAKQAGAWNASTDNLYKVLDKIGKQIMIDGSFQDRLPELDGENLELGKTIEEYFIDLTLPQTFDATGEDALAPHLPSVEDVSYSYTLGRRVIPTTVPYNNVERGCINGASAGNMIAKITQRLSDSYSLYKYSCKKQLLGNLAEKASEVTHSASLCENLAIPTDAASGEAFIQKVKEQVENASFASEKTSLSGALIGAATGLTLYVKKGVMPAVQVQTLAGAFNKDELAIPASVKVIDDFGDKVDTDVWAMLVDPRGIKMHQDYHAIRSQENAKGDFVNFYDHSEATGFISKYTFVHVFKKSA